jgi:hypothetical protein
LLEIADKGKSARVLRRPKRSGRHRATVFTTMFARRMALPAQQPPASRSLKPSTPVYTTILRFRFYRNRSRPPLPAFN